MTLQKFVNHGGCMISQWSAGYACQALSCNVKKLMTKDLLVIFEVCPSAAREISRFVKEHKTTLINIEEGRF